MLLSGSFLSLGRLRTVNRFLNDTSEQTLKTPPKFPSSSGSHRNPRSVERNQAEACVMGKGRGTVELSCVSA